MQLEIIDMDFKKKIRSFKINKDVVRLWGRRLVREIYFVPVTIFIRYRRWVNMGAWIAVVFVAAGLFARLLYFDPPGVVDIPETEQKLQVQVIDHLEFWLEEREAWRQEVPSVPQIKVLFPLSDK